MRYCLGLMAVLALPGCLSPEQALTAKSRAAVQSSCLGADACVFANAPVRLLPEVVRLPQRKLAFRPTAEALMFLNADRRQWVAPAHTLTDGASIPSLFVPLVGSPETPEFALASTLHDAYCGLGNEDGPVYHAETWQDVHIMFHDALIAGGTADLRARIMFAAVWLGGPRWDEPYRDLTGIGSDRMLAAMQGTIQFIETTHPTLAELILYLEQVERRLLAEVRVAAPARRDRTPADGGDGTSPITPGGGGAGAVQP